MKIQKFNDIQGQLTTEYIVIVAALVVALLVINRGCEPHESCVAKLLDVIDNNYQGFSYGVSGVQEYEEIEEP